MNDQIEVQYILYFLGATPVSGSSQIINLIHVLIKNLLASIKLKALAHTSIVYSSTGKKDYFGYYM